MVEIDDDVQGVANALHRIDHHFRLRHSEAGGYYVVYWKPDEWDEGDGYMILTAQECDHRIVKDIERIHWKCQQPGYSFADELDEAEAQRKADFDHEWTEQNGEMYERLAHALRQDLGYNQQRVFVPAEVPSGS